MVRLIAESLGGQVAEIVESLTEAILAVAAACGGEGDVSGDKGRRCSRLRFVVLTPVCAVNRVWDVCVGGVQAVDSHVWCDKSGVLALTNGTA